MVLLKVKHPRSTEYNILEETLDPRRTFDESGDYVLTNPEFDVREHLLSGTNRGIFTSGNGGLVKQNYLLVYHHLKRM